MRSSRLAIFVIGFSLLSAVCTTSGDTIAITEFLNHPGVTESTEWFELYNYGSASVNLAGWSLSDENGNTSMISSIVIPSGGYLVLTGNKIEFEADWFGGVANDLVLQFDATFKLTNAADQIVLHNDQSEVVWNIAWVSDEFAGLATFLTSPDFSITDYGSLAFPGISRSGNDLGMTDFLGYQQNNFTTDPFAFTATSGDFGSPLAGGYLSTPSPGALGLLGVFALHRRSRKRRHE